ncbi:hypothetical protein ACTXT7_012490, partial [Hymenolepis weldensis]
GTRLGRGYFEEADLSIPPPVYSHLCFVVHGMGQKYLKGSIITACDGHLSFVLRIKVTWPIVSQHFATLYMSDILMCSKEMTK